MPKVSDDHRQAQSDRFVDAARRCFTRLGVEGTSMENIRTEAGVSAGLMYRYFASKDDMIRAAIAGSMAEFEALAADIGLDEDIGSSLDFLRALLERLRQFRCHTEGVDLFRLAVQGWAHAQTRPEAQAVVTASFARQLEIFRRAATRWTTPALADNAGQAIAAVVAGYIVLSAFSPVDIDVDAYCAGLGALA